MVQGEVLAVGPGSYRDGKLVPLNVKIGNMVLLPEYGGSRIQIEEAGPDDEFVLYREDDLLAVLASPGSA